MAGIKKIRADEGYIDSTSFPATPAPSPFCPSPAQVTVFSPDQVAEGIQRLREESGASALSGASSGQPPTPSTTPGPGNFPPPLVNANLGIIPELLQESIDNLTGGTDEGLASTSSPATPIQTPHSPASLSHQSENGRTNHVVQPEQLAAGIHRLKVEEGMSSGGSSGFPSTPAPTPFSAHPGGVRPEELAAGISRLSVIEESGEKMTSNEQQSQHQQPPNLSQYFGQASKGAQNPGNDKEEEFFDNYAMMQSCRESKVDLTKMDKKSKPPPIEAEIAPSAQATEDERTLQRRQSQEDKHHKKPSTSLEAAERPTTLISSTTPIVTNTLPTPTTVPSNVSSSYATPVAPTPVTPVAPIFGAEGLAYSTYVSTPNVSLFNSNVPITSPLPMTSTPQIATSIVASTASELAIEDDDKNLTAEELRLRDLWIPNEAVSRALSDRNVESSMLTSAVVQGREEIQDPVRNMVLHYRGEGEAAKRNVLTANDVSQDVNGLNQLICAGCLRAAINLTSRLLSRPPFSTQHSSVSMRIWHVRIALMLRLKQFTTVETEAAAFGNLDNVDLYYQHYPEQHGDRQGTMAPFGFRILLAELPLHLGKPLEAMDRLYSLLAKVDRILQKGNYLILTPPMYCRNIVYCVAVLICRYSYFVFVPLFHPIIEANCQMWTDRKKRVLYALANCGIQQKDFESASKVLDQVLQLEEVEAEKAKVRSLQGRVFLQLGDLVAAMKFFDEAAKLNPGESGPSVEALIDQSCLSIASNNYLEAHEQLSKANAQRPHDPLIINNLSVCLLYLGRLKEALTLLESNLTSHPDVFLQESFILNLATLYELESSYAGQKKQSLLDLLSRHSGDGVNTACLKF